MNVLCERRRGSLVGSTSRVKNLKFICSRIKQIGLLLLRGKARKRRPTHQYRCDERVKDEGSTRLGYTGLSEGLEHLQIRTRLINERFASVMGACVI